MKLLAKLNLLLVLVFGLGLSLIAINARSFLLDGAKKMVVNQAELMSASALATRDYTEEEVSPILVKSPDAQDNFLPQTIPFYAATVTFNRMRKTFPEYAYREATLNPTNLADRADDWQADIVDYFRNHPGEKELVGQRTGAVGPTLYLAHPIVVQTGCLTCHSKPSVAPASLVRRYGTQNGFGWKPNEIVAAQIVSVPMSVPVGIANQGLRNLVISVGIIFFAAMCAIDAGMYFIVIRPLRAVSASADHISTGEIDQPPLPVKGKDEIAEVTTSFNRMHTSLKKAMEMLD
jgi:HAMP domain-containing protein